MSPSSLSSTKNTICPHFASHVFSRYINVGLLLREVKTLWMEALYVAFIDDIPDFTEPLSHKTAHLLRAPYHPLPLLLSLVVT